MTDRTVRENRLAARARWRAMIARCTNPANTAWQYYGGRGIMVCEEWLESFDAYYAHMGDPPFPGATVDREDNDGNYEPSNVRWATRAQQSMNRRHPNRVKTHCPRNHPYDETNTYHAKSGRTCKTCAREAVRRYGARIKAA